MDKLITKWTGIIRLKVFKIFDNTTAANYNVTIKSGYSDY